MILTAIFIISFALLGFIGGRLTSNGKSTNPPPTQTKVTASLEAAQNPLFKTQSATFQGKITKINGKTLTVESDNGQKGEFEISDNITIYTFPNNSPTASPSADLKLIETGKEVLVTLQLVDGKYEAVAMSYFRTVK